MSHALPEFPRMARYALSVALELAGLGADERLSSKQVAERVGVSAPMTAKVLRALSMAGLVEGVKGHHGGYRLAREPGTIRLVDVVAAATGESADTIAPQCALGARQCNPAEPCALHDQWAAAISPMQRLLERRTLADVLSRGFTSSR